MNAGTKPSDGGGFWQTYGRWYGDVLVREVEASVSEHLLDIGTGLVHLDICPGACRSAGLVVMLDGIR